MKKIFMGVLVLSTLWISSIVISDIYSVDSLLANTDVVTISGWPGCSED